VLCTDGLSGLAQQDHALLKRLGIVIREERIARLDGHGGQLEQIVFTNGERLPRRALFVRTQERQHSDLATKLGYIFPENRLALRIEGYQQAAVSGLYVAGNAYRNLWVIGAAAEGAEAAFLINRSLLQEDLAA
jgi:hypothetical protein